MRENGAVVVEIMDAKIVCDLICVTGWCVLLMERSVNWQVVVDRHVNW